MKSIDPALSLIATATGFLTVTEPVFTRHGLIVVNVGFEVRYVAGPQGFVSEPAALILFCVLRDDAEGLQATRKVSVPILGLTSLTALQAERMVERAIGKAVVLPFQAVIETGPAPRQAVQ